MGHFTILLLGGAEYGLYGGCMNLACIQASPEVTSCCVFCKHLSVHYLQLFLNVWYENLHMV
jgi:hypothetical protein